MAFWDFVKDSGKSVFGKAEAATPAAAPGPDAEKADIDRKVAALKAELKGLGLDGNDVHLTLRDRETVIVKSKGAPRDVLEKLVLAVGNIQGIARVEAPDLEEASAEDAPVFHTVKKGETLSAIAKEYLGNANLYNRIFEANKPMLDHPDKIYPGQMLRIPKKD